MYKTFRTDPLRLHELGVEREAAVKVPTVQAHHLALDRVALPEKKRKGKPNANRRGTYKAVHNSAKHTKW